MGTPRSLKDVTEAAKEYYAQLNKARKAKERAEKKLNELHKRNWIDLLVRPLAVLMAKKFPDRIVEVLGPFGLGAEVSIWFKKPFTDDNKLFETPDGIKSITFRPGDLDKGELRIVQKEEDTKTFAKDTIGAVNGLNHPVIPVTPDMTVKDLLKYVY